MERSIYKTGEREISNYAVAKLSRGSLINNGSEFDTINLQMHEVPEDAHSLLIADPKIDLSDAVIDNVSNYVDKGGNLLILGEIEKQHILNPITKPLGVTLMPGSLVLVSKNETPDKIIGALTLEFAELTGTEDEVKHQREEISHGHFTAALFPGAMHLQVDPKGFRSTKGYINFPDTKPWVKANKLIVDSLAPLLNPSEGDYKLDTFVIATALDRNIGTKNQRIGIVGDADFLSNLRNGSPFIIRSFSSWMSNKSYPIAIPKIIIENDIVLFKSGTIKTLKMVYVWILPAIFVTLGTIVLIRCRRQ